MTARHFSRIVLLLSLAVAAFSSATKECVYTVYIKTGSMSMAGTDSTISLTLSNDCGKSVHVSDLENWGLMGEKYDYYEQGSLDIFSGRGKCINPPICKLNLTSDGSGKYPDWYVEYVEVTFTGPGKACSETIFYVDQWLALDTYPYKLSAIVDRCEDLEAQPEERKKEPYFAGKAVSHDSE